MIKVKAGLLIRVIDNDRLPEATKVTAAVTVLIQALDQGITACAAAKTKLDGLTTTLTNLETKFALIANHIRD